ncbi:hypothetical protein M9H77_12056 [Catharanthus roseus]|uniref:Uncharacterized protein n=1 Tax=Catharanthus roseus TaxID=4058 RepID=A0ACC0BGC6_CATRO|nr:hypothetical protein M9H77_12056 [Catharanthus roseus]
MPKKNRIDKNGVLLTTATVETDSGDQTKEMTETEQMNGHRADERSLSSEKSSSSAAREKAEEQERVQVELKETERITNRQPGWPTQASLDPVKEKKDWARKLKKILGEVRPERPTISTLNNIFHP